MSGLCDTWYQTQDFSLARNTLPTDLHPFKKKKYLKGDLFYLMHMEVKGELGQVALLYISFYAPLLQQLILARSLMLLLPDK